MATLVNTQQTNLGLPVGFRQGFELNYNTATGTYNAIPVRAYTFVESVWFNTITTWSGGYGTIYCGDSTASAIYFNNANVSLGATNQNFSSNLVNLVNGATQSAWMGKLYTANDNIKVGWVQNANSTQGQAYIFAVMHYLPDLQTAPLYAAAQ